jgi:hypothetical protein
MEQGLVKGREETARNALAEGLPLEMIQKITGLDLDTLRTLPAERQAAAGTDFAGPQIAARDRYAVPV